MNHIQTVIDHSDTPSFPHALELSCSCGWVDPRQHVFHANAKSAFDKHVMASNGEGIARKINPLYLKKSTAPLVLSNTRRRA